MLRHPHIQKHARAFAVARKSIGIHHGIRVLPSSRPWLSVSRGSISPDQNVVQRCWFHASPVQRSDDTSAGFKETFNIPPATAQIRDLDANLVGQLVTLHGYLGARSDLSQKLSFVPLLGPDLIHSVQLISAQSSPSGESSNAHEQLKSLNQHTCVAVKGLVKQKLKPKGERRQAPVSRNEELEISITDLHVLNHFPAFVTFQEDTNLPPEQRHLQIRQSGAIRDALVFRQRVTQVCRDYLAMKHEFLEVETPLLFKSTPEGAREFLVPTRNKGFAYALPQSPQQYKQILMASGIPKYFQLAKCFRDEDLRADRQPEFTQLDLEMSFVTGQDVMNCVEGLIRELWKTLLDTTLPASPFEVMAYDDAMAKYGSDKPDMRLGMEISRIGYMLPVDLVSKIGPLPAPTVEVFKFSVSEEPSTTRQFISDFLDSPDATPFLTNPEGQPGIFIYDSRKPLGGLQAFGFEAAEYLEESMQLEEGDLVVIQARKDAPYSGGSTMLGNLRLALHRAAVAKQLIPAPNQWAFLWINKFPLFTAENSIDPGQGGSAGIHSTHHPFTAPSFASEIDLLTTDPLSIKADHYDLVLNGIELGGGSRRIHNADLQEHILRDVLKVSNERMVDFKHLIDVLRMGCPPHAGLALGFDRLVAVMLGRESIRDVIAFPKSGKGEDVLVRSPSRITEEQLRTYGFKLRE